MREPRSICTDLLGLAALTLSGCFTPNDSELHLTATDEGSSDDTGADTTPATSADTTDGSPTSGADTNDTDATDTNPTDADADDTNPTDTDATDTDATDTDATDADTTDTDTTTSDDGATTTDGGVEPFCGDDNVDPGEECDDGDANGPGSACLASCVANVCGDGDLLAGTEACDDGADNELEIGACAPDCSRVIEERVIRVSSTFSNGDFGNNPVAFADSHCPIGYAAMFVYPGVREATSDPYGSVDSIDWVLEPFTAYMQYEGETIWITDETPLLGVRDGVSMPLVDDIITCQLCALWHVISGLNDDWTTSVNDDCAGWTDDTALEDVAYGSPYDQMNYLNAGVEDCASWGGVVVYCVEQ